MENHSVSKNNKSIKEKNAPLRENSQQNEKN